MKNTAATTYEENLGHWIKRYYLLATQEMEAILQHHGLGRTQWYILYHIEQAGELPQKTLQPLLHITSATLTALVAALVRKGWIAQRPDPADKRGKLLRLTPHGKQQWHALPDPITAVKATALRGIPDEAIAQAITVIKAAVNNLEQKEQS